MSSNSTNVPEFVITHPRQCGLALIVIGLAFFYFSFVMPLMASAQAEETVTIYVKASIIGVVAIIVGTAFCLFGSKAVELTNPDPNNIQKSTVAFYIILMVVAFSAYGLLQHIIEIRGYVSS